ncbi:MAG TPA: hypothetical protein VFF14_00700 [Candidatus Deferrimicrobium sp.]|nr:hypothetical protein [Candidatus Deferrimicrobium sp.]
MKIAIVAVVLSICLFFGGSLLSTVVINSPLNNAYTITSEITNNPSLADAQTDIPKAKDASTNPHGTREYNSLTGEQRSKADAALHNLEIAITDFLNSEVEAGLMTKVFADQLQESIYKSLTINRSPVTESQIPQSGTNL